MPRDPADVLSVHKDRPLRGLDLPEYQAQGCRLADPAPAGKYGKLPVIDLLREMIEDRCSGRFLSLCDLREQDHALFDEKDIGKPRVLKDLHDILVGIDHAHAAALGIGGLVTEQQCSEARG